MITLTKGNYIQYAKIFGDIDGDGKVLNHLKKSAIVFILNNLFKNNQLIDFNKLIIGKKSYMQSSYITYNTKFIDDDGILKAEYHKLLLTRFKRIHSFISSGKINILEQELNQEPEEETADKNTIEQCEHNTYKLEEYHNTTHVNKALFESTGNCKFIYNFKKSGPIQTPDINIRNVQRFKVFINSKINNFSFPARLHYICNKCNQETVVDNNKIASNPTLACEHLNEITGKACNGCLRKPTQNSDFVSMNMYDCIYTDENGQKKNIQAMSMIELEGHEYDCAGLILDNNSQIYVHILDVQPITKRVLDLKLENTHENNIFNVMDYVDRTITEQTGKKILGMLDVKTLLLMQKLYHMTSLNRDFNVKLGGDADVGKTFSFDLYGTLLYNGKYKKTNGNSVSIPSLRGSAVSNIQVTKGNKNRLGLMTLMDCIYIDEINMNKELMPFLRPFLLENTFSNDKADGDKIEYPKTAFVNVAENPAAEHCGMYRGMIKKEYEKLAENPTYAQEFKEDFNEHWDLYQPLYTYTNPILLKAVKTVRLNFMKKDVHWIDGIALPDKDRFMGDLFLKRSLKKDSMKARAFVAMMSEVDTGIDEINLRMQMAIENVNDIFLPFVEYKDIEKEIDMSNVYLTIHEIIIEYNFETKTRLSKYCMRIANLSRMFNKRKDFTEMDFNMVRRYLMMRDRAVYPEDMEEFKIEKPTSIIEIENKVDIEEVFDNDMEGFE